MCTNRSQSRWGGLLAQGTVLETIGVLGVRSTVRDTHPKISIEYLSSE